MYNHVMIDIETLSTAPNALTVTIGACTFSLDPNEDPIGVSAQWGIDKVDAAKYGLHMDPNTVLWWMKQSQAARDGLEKNRGNTLRSVLTELQDFCMAARANHKRQELHLWANDPTFDCVILENGYKACDVAVPWNYYETRSCRTKVFDYSHFYGGMSAKKEFPRENTHHDAEADAIYQAELIRNITLTMQKDIGFTPS